LPSGYVICQVELFDPEIFDEYKAKVPDIVVSYGGETLVRGGRYERLEGAEPKPRIIVMKFPTYERALEWYRSESYSALKPIRQRAATADLVLVEGTD
jgi:uncharacterized protein (DUF1330 family)